MSSLLPQAPMTNMPPEMSAGPIDRPGYTKRKAKPERP